ncbi:T-lymphocyte activation antigen CD80 isoform X3 [Pangasianodon hypophthalmus]|uniref:T-lymphocyte activation antigen CD80 isoform X3 n=1 Tax=Pangasianodon hypophthalmus TaxID=310915 RepID=UPI000F00C9BC|nr:T-lymphocyte activation antigen CD80 isoform X3 [Pangasianodon hypophthalmus]
MRRGYLFLFVVISALQLLSAGDSPVVHHVQGFVGGSAHLFCVLERTYDVLKKVNGLYFQKTARDGTETFINGFYTREVKVLPEYKNRTIINKEDLSMEMSELSLADEGEYTCIPFVSGEPRNQTKFHLTVTANYSVPIITVQGCGSGPASHNCVIECSSSGGFPLSNVTWSAVGNEMSSLLRDEGEPVFMQDNRSHLWNVSHTVTLNCSQELKITCSVGGVMSPAVTVCLPARTRDMIVPIIACAVLLLVSIAISVIVICTRCRRTQTSAEHSTDAELVYLNSGQAG